MQCPSNVKDDAASIGTTDIFAVQHIPSVKHSSITKFLGIGSPAKERDRDFKVCSWPPTNLHFPGFFRETPGKYKFVVYVKLAWKYTTYLVACNEQVLPSLTKHRWFTKGRSIISFWPQMAYTGMWGGSIDQWKRTITCLNKDLSLTHR